MSAGKWGDLRVRIISALVMLAIGVAALVVGGFAYVALIAAVVAGMFWELTRMCVPNRPFVAIFTAILTGFVVLASALDPRGFLVELSVVPGLVAAMFAAKDRLILLGYGSLLVLSGMGLNALYAFNGVHVVVWLILVVVATDVAGYFAGKSIGGKKFWPSISPKKTWAGILAGWCAAAVVGGLIDGLELALISIAMSFASQLGDIAESAIKRRAGVKDSSNLIPGHGGLLDRFDGLVAANLVVIVALLWIGVSADLDHLF